MLTIEDRVAEILAEQLEIDREEIKSDSPFATELGADSLDQVRLMLEFEKVFSVKFPPGSVDRIQSVGEVVTLIEACRAA